MSTWVTGTTVVENSVDTENLTSNVTITLIVGWNGGSWASDNPYYYINVNGSRVKSGNANFNTSQASSGSQTIATWTGNVPHESDGTGSMTWAVGYEGIYAGEGIYSTASGTKTLTTIVVDDSNRFLDKTGLAYFWSKLKSFFVAKETGKGLSTEDFTTAEKTKLSGIETGAEVNVIESIALNGTDQTVTNKAVDLELVTSVNGQTGDVIVEGGEGGGTSNNMVTLWTNPNQSTGFSAQTVTLNEDASDFDLCIVTARYGYWQDSYRETIVIPDGLKHSIMSAQEGNGATVTYRDCTISGTSCTFGNGWYVAGNSIGNGANYCVPISVRGVKIKGVGRSSQLELLWTNSAPTSAFAQQTVALDLTDYDAVVIECNTAGSGTGTTAQLGFVGTTVRLMAEIYQIHRRLATINSDGITFGNNYYLPTYANGSESASNGYLIPTRIYGLRAVKPKVGKTLLWTNSSPTTNFSAQTITLSKDASNYDVIYVVARYSTTDVLRGSLLLFPDGNTYPLTAHTIDNNYHRLRWVTVNGMSVTFSISKIMTTNGSVGETTTNHLIPLEIYGINFSGTPSTPEYRSGDEETIVSTTGGEPYALIIGGLLTSATKSIYFTIQTPKSMAGVTPSLTSLKINPRHSGGGYMIGSSYVSGGTQVVGASGYTVTANKTDDYHITISVVRSSVYNGTNNTPCMVQIDELKLSFA